MKGVGDYRIAQASGTFAWGISDFDVTPIEGEPARREAGRAALAPWARAFPEGDGRMLFVYLARRKALSVDEQAWDALSEAGKLYFEALARGLIACTRDRADPAPPVVKVAAGPRADIRDTIYERHGRGDEKIGGDRPHAVTSTAQVHVERFAPGGPRDLLSMTPEQKAAHAAARGMGSTPDAELLKSAPPPGEFVTRNATIRDDGRLVSSKVQVWSPFASAVPPPLPDAAAAAGSGAEPPPAAAKRGKKKGS